MTGLVLAAGTALALDKVRVETRSDLASAKYGVTGKGVIFAMIDRGIDWRNKDFQNSDGTTRIAYIFDLTDNTGAKAPNNRYGVGTIRAIKTMQRCELRLVLPQSLSGPKGHST